MQRDGSSSNEKSKGKLPRRQTSKRSAVSALGTECVEIFSAAQFKVKSSPNDSSIADNTNGRSKRKIKQTERFNQYLKDRDAQSENVQNTSNVGRKCSKNNTIQIKIRILDSEEGLLMKDFEERDSNSGSNHEKVLHDKQITKLEQASARYENIIEVQQHCSETSDVKDKVKEPDEKPDIVNKKRKRNASFTAGKVPVKSKKIPDVPVTLQDYPESYCMEDYISSDPVDKGKSVEDKTCQRYLCKLCNAYRTVSEKQMEKHITLHVNKRLDCRQCGAVFNSLHNLTQHERQEHHEKVRFVCEHCGDDFSEKRLYKRHLSNVHKEAAFTCVRCQRQFLTNKDYKQHMLDEHENSAFKCESCDGIFVSEKMLERHQKNKVCERKLFECQECGRIKKSQAILDEHVRKIHSKEHCYKCNLCTYSTGQHYLLKHHMRAHLGIHPHKCDQCNFSCVKKWQLVSHMRTHSGEKRYKCQKCNYAAAWNVQLKTHMQAHESDTKEICKPCNIVFKDKKSFRTHAWKEHGESRKKKSELAIYKPNFRHDNISMIVGTNLAVYNTKKSVKSGVQTSGITTPLSICMKEEDSGSDREETIDTPGLMAPLSPKCRSLIDQNKETMHEDHCIAERNLEEQNYIFYQADAIPETANLCNNNLGNTRVISLLNDSTEMRTVKSFSGTVVGGMSGNFLNCGEQQVTTTEQPSPQSTEVQERHKERRTSLSKGHGSTKVNSTEDSSITEPEVMKQYYASHERGNSWKASSNTSNLNEFKAGFNLPLVNNKKVTLLRMHTNPDGTSRFETIDPDTCNTSPTETSQSTNTASAQEVHNYAVPIHKRDKKTA